MIEMIDISLDETVKRLTPELKEILKEELSLGNTLEECSIWKSKDTDWLFVLLNTEFKGERKTNLDSAEYVEINDEDFWKAEYIDKTNKQTIACKY